MVSAGSEKCLGMGERHHNVLGRQLHRIVKLCLRGGIISGVEGFYRGLEVTVGLGLVGRLCRGVFFEPFVRLVKFLAPRRGFVIVVIVSVACDYISRGIIAIPAVRMPSVPVVTPVGIAGPAAAETDKDEPAMVVRPEIAECEGRAATVADGTAAIRPGNPVEYPVRRVMLAMIMVQAFMRGWIFAVTHYSAGATCIRGRAGSGDWGVTFSRWSAP